MKFSGFKNDSLQGKFIFLCENNIKCGFRKVLPFACSEENSSGSGLFLFLCLAC